MHILCCVGLHKDRDLYRGPYDRWGQRRVFKCLRCGRTDSATFMSPLSGPPTEPMHPDAERYAGSGRPTPHTSPAHSVFAGTVFTACEAKDPVLFERLLPGTFGDFWREWKKVYPEDFPDEGMTAVSDIGAIVPRHQG